jgi:hypothetical protein
MISKQFVAIPAAALFVASLAWAAGGVEPAQPQPQPAPGADAIRALLLTGGHDHEAAFYSLFDDIDRLPVDTAGSAFKNDLRGKYNVLIMYDFTRDLDESGRKNLRDFVEAGGGSSSCTMPCSTTRPGRGGPNRSSAAAIASSARAGRRRPA